MSVIDPRLDQLMRGIGDPTSPAYQNLRAVIEGSPALMKQMNDAVSRGHLKRFAVMAVSENAGASYSSDTKTINLKLDDLLDATKRNRLTFLMGHEVQHGMNRERTRNGLEQFDRSVQRELGSGQSVHDYSRALEQMLSINRHDEASAHIAGWNALVSRLKHGNAEFDLSDMDELAIEVGYVNDFVDTQRIEGRLRISLKAGFTLNPDLSITPDSHNIEAAAKHFFDKRPDDTRLGHHGNSDYANYYAAGLVGSVCRYEMLNPALAGKLQLDMRGLKLNEKLLEQNGIWLGAPAARCPYQDTRAPHVAEHFDHTADSHQHVPIHGLPTPRQLQLTQLTQLDHPEHPAHKLFTEAQAGVHLLDAKVGRTPDRQSDRLASALVVAARTHGINRIDHVVLSTDASKVFAVQGALDSALKRIAGVPTVESLNTPISQSTQAWEQAMERDQQQVQERTLEQPLTMLRQARAMSL